MDVRKDEDRPTHVEDAMAKIRQVKDNLPPGEDRQALDYALMLLFHESVMKKEEREKDREARTLLQELAKALIAIKGTSEDNQRLTHSQWARRLNKAGMVEICEAVSLIKVPPFNIHDTLWNDSRLALIRDIAWRRYRLDIVIY